MFYIVFVSTVCVYYLYVLLSGAETWTHYKGKR